MMKIQVKLTVWKDIEIPDNKDFYKTVQAIQDKKITDANELFMFFEDKDIYFTTEYILDTEEPITEKQNNNNPCIEIIDLDNEDEEDNG